MTKAIASALLSQIEVYHHNLALSVDDNVIVLTVDTANYCKRPAVPPMGGAIIALPVAFPPHTLLAVLFEDGAIDIVALMQIELQKFAAGGKASASRLALKKLVKKFDRLVRARLLEIMRRRGFGNF